MDTLRLLFDYYYCSKGYYLAQLSVQIETSVLYSYPKSLYAHRISATVSNRTFQNLLITIFYMLKILQLETNEWVCLKPIKSLWYFALGKYKISIPTQYLQYII